MTVAQGRVSLRYTPGRWVAVTSAPDASGAIALLADLDAASPAVTACWDAIESGAGVDALLGVIVREGLRNVPSFAIAARDPGGVRVLVSGKARAEVTGPDGAPTVLDAAAAPTWLERTLPAATGARLLVPAAESGPLLALHGGVVLAAVVELGRPTAPGPDAGPVAAAGVSANGETQREVPTPPPVTPAPSQPASPHQSPPQVAPTGTGRGDSGLIESLPWLAGNAAPAAPPAAAPPPAPPAAPPESAAHNTMNRVGLADAAPGTTTGGGRTGPIVLAVACPNRHLGPPYAGICRVCGAQVPQQDPFSVPRPVLGTLNISTGAMVPLDRDVVLGRAPSTAETDRATRPHLVQLASPGNDISRNHVRIGLEGWHVLVTDLGSTNGTVVTLPGQQPMRLRAHDAFTIVPGTVVNIADEVNVRFEIAG